MSDLLLQACMAVVVVIGRAAMSSMPIDRSVYELAARASLTFALHGVAYLVLALKHVPWWIKIHEVYVLVQCSSNSNGTWLSIYLFVRDGFW